MGLRDRIERMASAGDAVKEIVQEVGALMDQLQASGSLSGGLKIVSFNPLEFEWRIDVPSSDK
jgi:hypothetical protein